MQHSTVLQPYLVSTAQHGDVLRDTLAGLRLTADLDLGVHRPGQSLDWVTGSVLIRLSTVLRTGTADVVVVQGDTASAFAGALAAFYANVPLVHLEAGLRSGNRREPFPEELHRRLISGLSDLHLAPTGHARDQLLTEGFPPESIEVTGNTVLDPVALRSTAPDGDTATADPRVVAATDASRRLVLATVHRRESWGPPLVRIADAVSRIADLPGVVVVLPLHPNPAVRETLTARLGGHESVVLTPWQPHRQFLELLKHAHLVLTDSGGVQEEAPSFGVPALVMREVTDRPEAVSAGLASLVGTDPDTIVAAARRLLSDDAAHAAMRSGTNPFGDGDAAPRCVAAIERLVERRYGSSQVNPVAPATDHDGPTAIHAGPDSTDDELSADRREGEPWTPSSLSEARALG